MTHNTTAAELEKLLAETTPGPWRIVPYDAGDKDEWSIYTPMIDGSEDADRAVVHWAGFRQKYWQSAGGKQSEIEANARLIAMSPTLARKVIAAEKLAEAGKSLNEQAAHVRQGASIRGMDITHAAIELGPLVLAFDDALAEWEQAQ